MAKKDNLNNNDPISKAVDLLLENTEDLTTVFKEWGLYKELTKRLVEKMLNSEMQNYLGHERNQRSNNDNVRNGTTSKKLITQQGKIEIDVPRDRNSNFEPVIITKRQRRFDGFDQQVLSLYAKGMTLSDIRMQLQELYDGADISESVISQITDDVIDDVKAWQNRPLDSVYPIIYFDCIVVKVRQDKRIINKSVYIALGVDLEGKKDVLGLWISENEGAKFWLNNFTEMKNRGLNDILIACSDNLTGMSEAIQSVYPKTEHQLCIVHQIRNSLKYVSYKHRKSLVIDLKPIYTACSEEQAMQALESFESKWNKQYPQIAKSWYKNWENLMVFISYPAEIKRVIYTTNAIESVNSQLRKVIRNKKVFPNDMAVFKIFYLAIENITKKWTLPIQNWNTAIAHFMIKFEDRINLN
ncbi:IS256 family transposase [Spiroplasma endosymbiont of Danaus chrysippus]|uniref:IS256 family transposase n=1 Tax=Spiroplasma endosymbiont of Danaus chrysippus TaxID=2691041 RepID=UPI0013CBC450|nr:IS256 family transposase [Spiroplasma endosymbiont of Danaus chrysippus]CAB1053688.1 Mobile element protein [Spiroplasma endosymbiont of Danaus chrysippus]